MTAPAVIARAAYGAALCVAPGALIRLAGGTADGRGRAVGRVLGVRHLTQAVLSASRPTAAVLLLGAEVDLLHSASMVALGVLDGPRRRLGLTDGVVAAAFAADELVSARRAVAAAAGQPVAGQPGAGRPAAAPDGRPAGVRRLVRCPGPGRHRDGGSYRDLVRYRDATAGWLVARTVPQAWRPWLTGAAGAPGRFS